MTSHKAFVTAFHDCLTKALATGDLATAGLNSRPSTSTLNVLYFDAFTCPEMTLLRTYMSTLHDLFTTLTTDRKPN